MAQAGGGNRMTGVTATRSGSLAASSAPGRALAWWLAVRPWSFTISLAPVLAGTSLAALDGYAAESGRSPAWRCLPAS